MNIYEFWKAVLKQDEQEIRNYFHQDARICWHCTNELFTLDEYIIANCEYPGDWDGVVERVELLDDLIISVTLVYPKDQTASYHVVSFLWMNIGQMMAVRRNGDWTSISESLSKNNF